MRIYNKGQTIEMVRGDSDAIEVSKIRYGGEDVEPQACVFSAKKKITDREYAIHLDMNQDGQFIFNPDTTAALDAGEYVFDIQVTLNDGTVITPLIGQLELIADVTHQED